MYLKQLEMQGFKSFPEKIRLKFGSGITAVVGPNGSGKSNVADAVRWVLGEAGAKNLRGQKMEDVIFAGTQNRKPLGFAEVSLIMDNADGKLPLDCAEVTVTRRLYRSGESAYLINGVNCRRRDILELFMDTGVGKEGYSIIGQGRIDEILSVKSEDRRALFEEAAGIVKFKNRRNEAQKKLDNERANLLRCEDIIAETESRLGPLEAASKKAKKYLDLAEKLKDAEINLFVLDAKKYEEQADKLKASAEDLQASITQTENSLEKAEAKKAENKEASENLNSEIDALSSKITELKVKYTEKLNEISLINAEREHTETEISKLLKDGELSERLKAEKLNEIKQREDAAAAKKLAYATLSAKSAEAEREYKALSEEVNKKETAITDLSQKIMLIMETSAGKKEEIAKAAQRLETVKERKARLEGETAEREGQLNEKETSVAALKKDEESILNSIKTLTKSHEALLEESRNLSRRKDELEKKQKSLSIKLNETKSKINILSSLEASYEGYFGGVKAVLKNKNSLRGVCGAVGEVITVKKEYELAIETALGGALQNIITEDEEAAKEAVNYLKRTKSGRATFMPLTAARRKQTPLSSEITGAKGFVGAASDLVTSDDKFKPIVLSLLGRTAVTDTIESGIALAKKIGYSTKIVTLTGEVFNVGGSITGGSDSKKRSGILSRKTELEGLKTELESLNAENAKAEDSLAAANFNLTSVSRDIEQNRRLYNNENLRLSALREKIRGEKLLLDEISERLKGHTAELTALEAEETEARRILDKFSAGLSSDEAEITSLNESLDAYRSRNTEGKAALEEKNSLASSLRLEAERRLAELSSEEKDILRLKAETEELDEKRISGDKTAEELRAKTEADKLKAAEITKEAENINGETEKLSDQHNAKLKERYGINNLISETENEIRELNDTLLDLNKQKTTSEERIAALNEKSRGLYDSMWENYEITYPEAVKRTKASLSDESKSPAKLRQTAKELKGKIKALGSINPEAPQEYAETLERYEFLTSQRNDILKAEQDLSEITNKLEALMKEMFAERFKAINENFKIVFREMFGGGHANISLSDENDVLNSGIEINAQPPGKKLQSMLLLSGGEKALTAMALLFAILRLKPSPFCVLDEIEAALDDPNVNRYAKYIRKLSGTTQFIVITHRKGTMEEADALYGITMQEQGISKMVSVSLKEADALSE